MVKGNSQVNDFSGIKCSVKLQTNISMIVGRITASQGDSFG